MAENLAVAHPATSRHMRPFLTKPEPVAEAGAAKDEIIARARDFKPRAFDHLPSQRPSDNQLKIPTSNQAAASAFNCERLGPARGVPPGDCDRNESLADVRAFVALQSLGKLIGRYLLRPAAVRHRRAKIVAHASKVRGRGRAPQRLDVRGHPAAGGMKVRVNDIAQRIAHDHSGRLFDGASRSPFDRPLRLRKRETLAMRGGTEIVALARVPPEVLHRECATDDGLSLQSLDLILDARFGGQHADQVLFQRQFARDVFADRTNPDRLRIGGGEWGVGSGEWGSVALGTYLPDSPLPPPPSPLPTPDSAPTPHSPLPTPFL